MSSLRRAIAVVSLIAALQPTVSAVAADRDTARACPRDVPDAFVDDEGNIHERNIDCIAYWAITTGTSATQYSPGAYTRRDQMATFVTNFMARGGFTLPANPADVFDDDEMSVHELGINQLADTGVVAGSGGGHYSPAELVRRDQMATFVVNAIETVTGVALPDAADAFVDDVGNLHESNIDKLAGIGVVVGKATTIYDPASYVRRDQMASFLAKAADYLAEEGRWPAFGSNQSFRVTPSSAATLTVGAARSYIAFVGDAASVGVGEVDCGDVAVGAVVSFTGGVYDYVAAITPVDGVVRFDVDGGSAGECERPVVFADLDGDEQLDLGAGGRPTEPFGVGGAITWMSSGGGGGGGGGGSTGTTITDVRAHDVGTTGVVDADDVHQFIFSEPVATTVDDPGSMYRLDGAMDVVLGTNANAVLMPGGTYNGAVYPDNQVMRVYITGAPSVAAVGGGGVSYPTTITEISASWVIDLANSADKVIEAAAISPVPEADSTQPNMFIAVADELDDRVTVTYTEAVVCDGGATQFSYTDSDNTTAVAATSLSCSGTTLVVAFPDGVIEAADTNRLLRYLDDNAQADSNDVRDVNGLSAMTPDNIAPLLQA